MNQLSKLITVYFRWLTSYIKWHWAELNDRVEHDSMLERSREKAIFETNREQQVSESKTSPVKQRNKSAKSIQSYKMNNYHNNHILPAHRLDPEGGNDEDVEHSVHTGVMAGDADASSDDGEMDNGVQDQSKSIHEV